MTVDPREAWTDVAEQIAARPDGSPAAGDHSRFIALQDRALVENVFSRMEVDGREVLEVGCGPGGKLARVLTMGRPARLVGADLTPKMVEISSRRFEGTDVEIVQLERGRYPFEDGEFDTVFTCTVLHHNPSERLPEIIAEIARVSRGEVWLFESATDRREISAGNFHVRRVSAYSDLFAAHGFELTEEHRVRVALSNLVANTAQRLAHSRRLGRPAYREGTPLVATRRVIEGALLPVTSRIDPLVPTPTGLRGLRFRRIA